VRLRLFLGMWALLAFVAALTIVASERLRDGGTADDQVVAVGDDASTSSPDTSGAAGGTAPAPRAGQVRVTGTLQVVLLGGAVLEPRTVTSPLTVVSERGFGNGGELTGILVDGRRATAAWDGGRPLVLSGRGGLVLDPVEVTLGPGGLELTLGGGNHGLMPGTYQLDTPVAVGAQGIATPYDRLTFEADGQSVFEALGDASLVLGPQAPHRFLGPGRVLLEGELTVTDEAGTRGVPRLAVEVAAFDLTLTPTAEGAWRVDGLVGVADEP